jgi:hypothetical protein
LFHKTSTLLKDELPFEVAFNPSARDLGLPVAAGKHTVSINPGRRL